MSANVKINKRKFFRVKHDLPLCASMSIYSVNGRMVMSRGTFVCIKNIGPGGLCFLSNLSFPAINTAIFSFKLLLLGSNFTFYGYIVRSKPVNDQIKEYGVKFTETLNNSMEVAKIMNQWSIAINKKKLSDLKNNCSLCTKKSMEDCFANRKSK